MSTSSSCLYVNYCSWVNWPQHSFTLKIQAGTFHSIVSWLYHIFSQSRSYWPYWMHLLIQSCTNVAVDRCVTKTDVSNVNENKQRNKNEKWITRNRLVISYNWKRHHRYKSHFAYFFQNINISNCSRLTKPCDCWNTIGSLRKASGVSMNLCYVF